MEKTSFDHLLRRNGFLQIYSASFWSVAGSSNADDTRNGRAEVSCFLDSATLVNGSTRSIKPSRTKRVLGHELGKLGIVDPQWLPRLPYKPFS